jgi:hypothetical protein
MRLCMEPTFVTTSQPTRFLFEIESGDIPIPPGKLAYFQERLRNNIYHFVLTKFHEKEREGLTKALLARRLGSDPAVVSRLLGAPGNWTLDTISNLLLGIAAEELKPASVSVLNRAPRNFVAPEWLSHQHPHWLRLAGQQPEAQSLQPPAQVHRMAVEADGTAPRALALSSLGPLAQSKNASTTGQSLPPELLGERHAA